MIAVPMMSQFLPRHECGSLVRQGVTYRDDCVVDKDIDTAVCRKLVDSTVCIIARGREQTDMTRTRYAASCSSTWVALSRIAATVERSAMIAEPLEPLSLISVTTSWVASSSMMSTIATAAQPARARHSATPRPIPLRAPVTSARLPARALLEISALTSSPAGTRCILAEGTREPRPTARCH